MILKLVSWICNFLAMKLDGPHIYLTSIKIILNPSSNHVCLYFRFFSNSLLIKIKFNDFNIKIIFLKFFFNCVENKEKRNMRSSHSQFLTPLITKKREKKVEKKKKKMKMQLYHEKVKWIHTIIEEVLILLNKLVANPRIARDKFFFGVILLNIFGVISNNTLSFCLY